MRFTGKLKEPIIDFVTHRLTILFEPNEDFLEAYEELKGKEVLSLEIKPYRKKRSLDANAYYWVLLTKLAKVMNTSNAEMHNLMLIHYGEPEIIEGKPVYMTVPDTEDAEKKVMQATEYHLMPTSQVRQGLDGIMYRTYKLLRGSSTYDPSEMATSVFISVLIRELYICLSKTATGYWIRYWFPVNLVCSMHSQKVDTCCPVEIIKSVSSNALKNRL